MANVNKRARIWFRIKRLDSDTFGTELIKKDYVIVFNNLSYYLNIVKIVVNQPSYLFIHIN